MPFTTDAMHHGLRIYIMEDKFVIDDAYRADIQFLLCEKWIYIHFAVIISLIRDLWLCIGLATNCFYVPHEGTLYQE
jgi:hypothetical protein